MHSFPIRLAIGALGVLLLAGCSIQLERPRAAPVYPIEGLWASVEDDYNETGRGQLLYVSSPGSDEYPFKFTLFQYYMRDLAVSGRRMFFIRRSGVIDTSDEELLMKQIRYQSGYRDNISEGDESEFWPASDFEPETLKRNLGTGEDLDLLRFASNGAEIEGDEFHFRRVLPAAGDAQYSGELDVAYVIGVRKDGRSILSIGFNPSIHVSGAERAAWGSAGQNARLKIEALVGDLAQASVVDGKVQRGDVVVMPGWKPKAEYKRKLNREEVLRMIQRGETVPREDLIRVLGKDAVN